MYSLLEQIEWVEGEMIFEMKKAELSDWIAQNRAIGSNHKRIKALKKQMRISL
jgi:hypothetical protein